LHFQLVGVVVGGMSLFVESKMPSGLDWLFLFLIGVFSQLGQMFLTDALQRERAAGVAIINYTGLIYAIVFGTLLFGERIVVATLAGMAMVVAGILLSIYYSRRQPGLAELDVTQA